MTALITGETGMDGRCVRNHTHHMATAAPKPRTNAGPRDRVRVIGWLAVVVFMGVPYTARNPYVF
jgi:hypothetical protein